MAEGKETRELFRPHYDGIGYDPGLESCRKFAKPPGLRRPRVRAGDRLYDLALEGSHKADPFGNLVYRRTALELQSDDGDGGSFVIAEVDQIVGLGDLDAESVHTRQLRRQPHRPGEGGKAIEQRTVSEE